MKAVNPAGHWKFVVGRETVKLFSRTNETIPLVFTTVPNAKRWDIDKQVMAQDAQLAKSGIRWALWRSQLSGKIPKPGDIIEDQYGVRWIIQFVRHEAPGQTNTGEVTPHQRFDCTCLQSQKAA